MIDNIAASHIITKASRVMCVWSPWWVRFLNKVEFVYEDSLPTGMMGYSSMIVVVGKNFLQEHSTMEVAIRLEFALQQIVRGMDSRLEYMKIRHPYVDESFYGLSQSLEINSDIAEKFSLFSQSDWELLVSQGVDKKYIDVFDVDKKPKLPDSSWTAEKLGLPSGLVAEKYLELLVELNEQSQFQNQSSQNPSKEAEDREESDSPDQSNAAEGTSNTPNDSMYEDKGTSANSTEEKDYQTSEDTPEHEGENTDQPSGDSPDNESGNDKSDPQDGDSDTTTQNTLGQDDFWLDGFGQQQDGDQQEGTQNNTEQSSSNSPGESPQISDMEGDENTHENDIPQSPDQGDTTQSTEQQGSDSPQDNSQISSDSGQKEEVQRQEDSDSLGDHVRKESTDNGAMELGYPEKSDLDDLPKDVKKKTPKEKKEIERELSEDMSEYEDFSLPSGKSILTKSFDEWREKRKVSDGVKWKKVFPSLLNPLMSRGQMNGKSDMSFAKRNPNQIEGAPILMGFVAYPPEVTILVDGSPSMYRYKETTMKEFVGAVKGVCLAYSQPVTIAVADSGIKYALNSMTPYGSVLNKISRTYHGSSVDFGETLAQVIKKGVKYRRRTFPKPDIVLVFTDGLFTWPFPERKSLPSHYAKILVVSTKPYEELERILPPWVKNNRNFIYAEDTKQEKW